MTEEGETVSSTLHLLCTKIYNMPPQVRHQLKEVGMPNAINICDKTRIYEVS